MVLTQERDTTNYIATMEAAYRTTEVQLFGNIPNTCVASDSMSGEAMNIRVAYGIITAPPMTACQRLIPVVQEGKKLAHRFFEGNEWKYVNISVQCYYTTPGGGSTNYSSFIDVLTSLRSGPG